MTKGNIPSIKKEIPFAVIIGFRLKVVRYHKGMKLAEAAKCIGIAPRTLKRIEEGEVNWRFTTVAIISKYYNYSLKDLFAEEKDK